MHHQIYLSCNSSLKPTYLHVRTGKGLLTYIYIYIQATYISNHMNKELQIHSICRTFKSSNRKPNILCGLRTPTFFQTEPTITPRTQMLMSRSSVNINQIQRRVLGKRPTLAHEKVLDFLLGNMAYLY